MSEQLVDVQPSGLQTPATGPPAGSPTTADDEVDYDLIFGYVREYVDQQLALIPPGMTPGSVDPDNPSVPPPSPPAPITNNNDYSIHNTFNEYVDTTNVINNNGGAVLDVRYSATSKTFEKLVLNYAGVLEWVPVFTAVENCD